MFDNKMLEAAEPHFRGKTPSGYGGSFRIDGTCLGDPVARTRISARFIV
jgi:hypothetical protein